MPQVILQSSDGHNFTVDLDVARMSLQVRTMLKDLGYKEEKPEPKPVIPLPNVHGEILRLVVAWCEEHKGEIPTPEDEEDDTHERRRDDISPWDQNFLNLDQAIRLDLITAANYLDLKGLLDLCCKHLANIFKAHGPEELRQMFNIRSDMAPVELEQIHHENDYGAEEIINT